MSGRAAKIRDCLRHGYLTADPRSLGLLRLALGWLLFVDLARRLPDAFFHYSNEGWLTNHFVLFQPMSSWLFSPHLAFSTSGEVLGLLFLQLVVYLLFMVGYRTKLTHTLSALLLVGLNSRNVAVENGGYVVLSLLTIWTLFLPLGRRFSVDALLASLRERREGTARALNDRSMPRPDERPVVSLAVLALIVQWAAIYSFNVAHKTGPEWRDGTALHYLLQQDRMVTACGAALRDQLPLWAIQGMTWGALVIESAVAVLLLSPYGVQRLRMAAWALAGVLHLAIALLVDLGPFSYAMITAFFAFLPREFWQWARQRLLERRPTAEVGFDAESGFSIALCRLIKRFDGLQRVRFAENPGCRGLCMRLGNQRRRGLAALRALTAVLPMPALGALFLRVPGLSSWLEKQLAAPSRATSYFELERLPGSDEQQPPRSALQGALARGRSYLSELLVAFLTLVALSQMLLENGAVPDSLRPSWRPAWVEAVVVYPRMFQGWSMFAPSPPTTDGVLVVEALTRSGQRVDPLTDAAPNDDVQPPGGFRLSQMTADFHRRMADPRFEPYLEGVREYVKNYPERTGRPEDEIVRFDVFWLEEHVPPPGRPHGPATKRRLLSFEKPATGAPKPAPAGLADAAAP